jgi:hypothetical protein
MRSLLLVLGLLTSWLPVSAARGQVPNATGSEPGLLCRAAVEREAGLPPRLLSAIARVESGRRAPVTGAFHPWPWTINAEGRGSFYPSKAAAIAAVRELQAQGVRSIDIGCMQVNLRHYPRAFASLEEAFDPVANARYAARFLAELHSMRGDWMRAANYHSQTPKLAEGYRARIAEALMAEQGEASAPVALAAQRAAPMFRPGQPGGGYMLSNRMEQAPLLPAPGGGGNDRGLDAYRNLSIPVAGRGPVPGLARAQRM